MPGELQGDRVYVRDQSEANRIYNKGGWGRPLSGGALELDLVEAAYLHGAGRLQFAKPFEGTAAFLAEAARTRPSFGVQYLAYRDLREHRPNLRLASQALRADGIDFRSTKEDKREAVLVKATSERTPIALADLHTLAERARKESAAAVVAVVDEESEVTQYAITLLDPKGTRQGTKEKTTCDALLLFDRVLVTAGGIADELHDREFFGKKAPGGYYLSLVEALHLMVRGRLRITNAATQERLSLADLRRLAKTLEPGAEARYAVYEDLKARGLIVKTGYKFGTHFRAYQEDPRSTHAPYLVQAVRPEATFEWPELSRAIRLAHGVRKEFLLAEMGSRSVNYVGLSRLR